MKKIKYRQPLYSIQTGKFMDFHYWGQFEQGNFVSAMGNSHAKKGTNDMYSTLDDRYGKELFENDLIINLDRNGGRPHVVEFIDGKFVGTYGTMHYDLYQDLSRITKVGTIYKTLSFKELERARRKANEK